MATRSFSLKKKKKKICATLRFHRVESSKKLKLKLKLKAETVLIGQCDYSGSRS